MDDEQQAPADAEQHSPVTVDVEDDPFAPLDSITVDDFAVAFQPANISLQARLKDCDLGRYTALRQKWKEAGFPGLGDLSRRVDEVLKAASRRAKARESAEGRAAAGDAQEGVGRIIVDPKDPRNAARAYRDHVRPNLIFSNGTWLDYRVNCYVEIEEAHIRSELWAFLEQTVDAGKGSRLNPSSALVTSVTDALNGLCFRERAAFTPPVWLDREASDPNPGEVLACRNCLLHIPTEQEMPLTSRFFTYNGLPYDYTHWMVHPEPTAWLKFLSQIWPDSPQSISSLQEIFGYLLTNDTSQQKVFLLVGPPRCGKGTIGRILTALLGKENCTSPSLKALGQNFGMESLIGKQLMLVSDMRLSRNTDTGEITGNILRISGEDDVNVQRKFKGDWRGRLSTRIFMLSNVPLIMPDMSGALVNRLVPLVIKESFLGREDPQLTDKLLAELPGILNWAIQGWQRLKARGHFELTAEGAELNAYTNSMAAPVQTFLAECCEVRADVLIQKSVLYEAFTGWSEANDIRWVDASGFGRELMVASGYRVTTTRPRDANGKQIPHYAGVTLKPGWDDSINTTAD